LVIVDADPQARSATEAALVRRFDPDSQTVSADSATTGLAVLEKLASQGAEVAIVAADLKLPGMDGVAFLELAHELHRDASRVLLLAMDRNHTQIPLSELATLQQATALGRIDFWIVKGWVTPEEWLYPQAAGDVRYGSVKRVAGAVGEGSVTVGSVHRYLADAPAVIRPSAGPR